VKTARLVVLVVLFIIFACLASGCATFIDEHQPPPEGWPVLAVYDEPVSGWEVLKRCYPDLPLWQKLLLAFPLGCVQADLAARICYVWRTDDMTLETLEHEHAHCRGYSHWGETWAHDVLREHRAATAGAAVSGSTDRLTVDKNTFKVRP
jgi:hypothetical protein